MAAISITRFLTELRTKMLISTASAFIATNSSYLHAMQDIASLIDLSSIDLTSPGEQCHPPGR